MTHYNFFFQITVLEDVSKETVHWQCFLPVPGVYFVKHSYKIFDQSSYGLKQCEPQRHIKNGVCEITK